MKMFSCHALVFIAGLVLSTVWNISTANASFLGSYQRHLEIRHGQLDLSDWDVDQNGAFELEGQWRFFWNRLLSPDEIDKIGDLEQPQWMKVPGAWNDVIFNGARLPGNGVATYCLRIRLPQRDGVFALRMRDVFTAYRLFINDKPVVEVGRVSENRSRFIPDFDQKLIFFPANQPTVNLTLQIANYAMPHGGPFHAPQLGTAEAIAEQSTHKGFLEMFLFGLLLIMALYHFGLFFLRRDDKSALWFGLFCLVVAIRVLITGERIGFNLFSDWHFAFALDILTIFWAAPLFYIFFQSIYPDHLSKKAIGFTWGFALVNSVVILATPANFYVNLLLPSHVLFVVFGIYIIVCLILEIKAKSDGAVWAATGFGILFLTLIHDILASNRIIHTPYLTIFGVFAFILAQSYLLSMRFSKAFRDAKIYGDHLRQEMVNRISVEKKLRRSERKFRELADFLPITVVELDFDFNLFYANVSARKMFGLTIEAIKKGANVRQFIPDENMEEVRSSIESLRSGVIPEPLELYLIKNDGQKIWGQAFASVIGIEEKSVGIRACFVDLSDRKAAERKLQRSHAQLEAEVERRTEEIREAMEAAKESNQLKSEFLANISHELRNPMHQILSYSKFGISKIEKPKERLLHYFIRTRDAAERLMVLLNDLLDLSRLESGKADYQFEHCDINKIVKEVVMECKQAFVSVKLSLLLSGISDPIEVHCDSFKIGQVIRNLLTNSVKYSGESKEVEISVEVSDLMINDQSQQGVRVSVKDYGVGVPENELETIFDKFTQSSFTKTGAGGTGLGLAICQEIISAHRGVIWAVNNEDRGATFSFILPLSKG